MYLSKIQHLISPVQIIQLFDISDDLSMVKLTLYHTIPAFIDPKEGFGKLCRKGENAGNQHFLLFPVFSTLSKRETVILAKFNLSSASAYNFFMSKILMFGKELRVNIGQYVPVPSSSRFRLR